MWNRFVCTRRWRKRAKGVDGWEFGIILSVFFFIKFRAIVKTCKLCEVRQSDSLINEQRIVAVLFVVCFFFFNGLTVVILRTLVQVDFTKILVKKSELIRIFKLPISQNWIKYTHFTFSSYFFRMVCDGHDFLHERTVTLISLSYFFLSWPLLVFYSYFETRMWFLPLRRKFTGSQIFSQITGAWRDETALSLTECKCPVVIDDFGGCVG